MIIGMKKSKKEKSFLADSLAHIVKNSDVKNWGTFKDSLRAPVHRWFTYPAGFSYKAVEHSLERYKIVEGMTVYDPFMGSGTTNLTCKTLGVNSVGVEAHPLVFKITQAKMNWNLKPKEACKFIDMCEKNFEKRLKTITSKKSFDVTDHFPELIFKCYPLETVKKLYTLREMYLTEKMSRAAQGFFYVVLTALLRNVSSAATGWPYIAPKKLKITSESKCVKTEFVKLARRMVQDLQDIQESFLSGVASSNHNIFRGDSRDTKKKIEDESVDHIFTSPPYLNNFDYADRTRLELYFWGEAKTWGEISAKIRTKLITSATTQINRSDSKYELRPDFIADCPEITKFLQKSADKLGEVRLVKGGKKSYDLMVLGYFNDLYLILKDCYRVLRPNTKALFVLGDSAPYGVHIPTDKLIGEIGLCLGFADYKQEVLRKRGDKWKSNPQRHSVALQESIIILEKK